MTKRTFAVDNVLRTLIRAGVSTERFQRMQAGIETLPLYELTEEGDMVCLYNITFPIHGTSLIIADYPSQRKAVLLNSDGNVEREYERTISQRIDLKVCDYPLSVLEFEEYMIKGRKKTL